MCASAAVLGARGALVSRQAGPVVQVAVVRSLRKIRRVGVTFRGGPFLLVGATSITCFQG